VLRPFIVSVWLQPTCSILGVAGLGALRLDVGLVWNCTTWCIVHSVATGLVRKLNFLETLWTLGFFNVSVGLLSPWSIHGAAGLFSLLLIAGAARNGTAWCIVLTLAWSRFRKFTGFEMLRTFGLFFVGEGPLPTWSILGIAGLGSLRLIDGAVWSGTAWCIIIGTGCIALRS